MSVDNEIRVGFASFWDSSGDKSVIKAVEDLAQKLNEILKGSIDFSATLQSVNKMSDALGQISEKVSKMKVGAKGFGEELDKEAQSAENLLKTYRELDLAASQRGAGLKNLDALKQEIALRKEALDIIRQMKAQGGDYGINLGAEFGKQEQLLKSVNTQYARMLKDSNEYTADLKQQGNLLSRYKSELQNVAQEMAKTGKQSYGSSGIEAQLDGLKRIKLIREEAAQAGVMSSEKDYQLIGRYSQTINALSGQLKAMNRIEGEDRESVRIGRRTELAQIQALTQQQAKYQAQLSGLSSDNQAHLDLRAKLEKQISDIILQRIALGDKGSASLIKDYDLVSKTVRSSEELVRSYQARNDLLKQPRGNTLDDIKNEIELRKSAIKELNAMEKMGVKSIDVAGERNMQLSALRDAASAQSTINQEIRASIALQDRKNKLIAEEVRLAKQIEAGRQAGGIGGLETELSALRQRQGVLSNMSKIGMISSSDYTLNYSAVKEAIGETAQKLNTLRATSSVAAAGMSLDAKKEADAIAKLYMEYAKLEKAKIALGESNSTAAQRQKIVGQQLTITSKLMKDQVGDTDALKRTTETLSAEHMKLGNVSQETYKKMGRSFTEMLAYQAEWYVGTLLLFGSLAGISKAFHDSLDLSQELRNSAAIANATTQEYNDMQKAVVEVSTSTAVSALDAAKALKVLGQAGLSARESMEALNTVAMLTVAADGSIEQAVGAVTTVMKVWSIEASKASDIGNTMAAMLNYSKLAFNDLSTIFNYLASTAEQVNYTFDETASIIAVLANHGIKASTIGTGLSSVLAALVAPTEKMLNMFHKFKLTGDDIDPQLNSFTKIISKMKEAGITSDDLFKSMNRREARIMVSALNAGSEEFDKMSSQIKGTNALLEINADVMEGTKNQLTLLGNEMQANFVGAFNMAEPVIKGVVSGLRSMMATLRENQSMMAAATAGLTLLGGRMLWVAAQSKYVVAAFTALGGGWALTGMAALAIVTIAERVTRSREKDIESLKEQSDQYTVAAERIRQEQVNLKGYSEQIEKSKGSQDKLLTIKANLLAQYPAMISYMSKEGKWIGDSADEYGRLTAAINGYSEAKLRELDVIVKSQVTNHSEQLSKIDKELESIEDRKGNIKNETIMITTPFAFFRPEVEEKARANLLLEESKWYDKRKESFESFLRDIQSAINKGANPQKIVEAIWGDKNLSDSNKKYLIDQITAVAAKSGQVIEGVTGRTWESTKNLIKFYDEYYKGITKTANQYYDNLIKKEGLLGEAGEEKQAKMLAYLRERAEVLKYFANDKQLADSQAVETSGLDPDRKKEELEKIKQEYEKTLNDINADLLSGTEKYTNEAISRVREKYNRYLSEVDVNREKLLSSKQIDFSDPKTLENSIKQVRFFAEKEIEIKQDEHARIIALMRAAGMEGWKIDEADLKGQNELAKKRLDLEKSVRSQINDLIAQGVDRIKLSYEDKVFEIDKLKAWLERSDLGKKDQVNALRKVEEERSMILIESALERAAFERKAVQDAEISGLEKADRMQAIERALSKELVQIEKDTRASIEAIYSASIGRIKDDYSSMVDDLTAKHNDAKDLITMGVEYDPDKFAKLLKLNKDFYANMAKQDADYYASLRSTIQDSNMEEWKKQKELTKLSIEEQKKVRDNKLAMQADMDAALAWSMEKMSEVYAKKIATADRAITQLDEIMGKYYAQEDARRELDKLKDDAYREASIGNYDKRMQVVQKRALEYQSLNAQLLKQVYGEEASVAKEAQKDIVKAYEDKSRAVIATIKEEYQAKQWQLGMITDEEEYGKKSKEIWKESVDAQVGVLEKLRQKIGSVYDAADARLKKHLERIKEINDKEKSILGDIKEASESLGGKAPGPDVITAQNQVRKLLENASLDSRGMADMERAVQILKSLDQGAIKGGFIDQTEDIKKLYDQIAQKVSQISSLQREKEISGAKDEASTMEGARKKMESLRTEIEGLLEKPFEINLVPKFDREAALKRLEEAAQAAQGGGEIVKVGDTYTNVPSKIKADTSQVDAAKKDIEANPIKAQVTFSPETSKVDSAKVEVQQPTTSTHTVTPDTSAAVAAIQQLMQTTHSTHVVHVVQVGAGGGGEAPSPEGYATGGYLGGGWGGGDRLHILAEMGEYVTNKNAVRHYGRSFFEALNARAIPSEVIHSLIDGRIPRFADGGMVGGEESRSMGVYNVHFSVGSDEVAFPVKITRDSKEVFDQFLDRYDKERLMRRRK